MLVILKPAPIQRTNGGFAPGPGPITRTSDVLHAMLLGAVPARSASNLRRERRRFREPRNPATSEARPESVFPCDR